MIEERRRRRHERRAKEWEDEDLIVGLRAQLSKDLIERGPSVDSECDRDYRAEEGEAGGREDEQVDCL